MNFPYEYQNYIKFPNSIIDNIHIYTGDELKILCILLCYPNDWTEFNKIKEKTKLEDTIIHKNVFSLLNKSTIFKMSGNLLLEKNLFMIK
jgi:hypothetical protein